MTPKQTIRVGLHGTLAVGDIVYFTPPPRRPSWLWLLLVVPFLLFRRRMRAWRKTGHRIVRVDETTLTIL